MLPDEHALQATVTLEEHGFSVEVAGDLDAARQAVLARIPEGSLVMTSTSVTLEQTGLADVINDGGGRWESARSARSHQEVFGDRQRNARRPPAGPGAAG